MNTRGFTLIELLVVMVIMAALAGIGIPVGRSVLASSREASCLNNLRTLGVGLEGYLQDHQRRMPDIEVGRDSKTGKVSVLEITLLPYMESPESFHCPQDFKEFDASGSSYFWNSTQSGLRLSELAFFGIKGQPEKIPLIADKEAWHPGGTNFLYADQTSSKQARFTASN